MPTHGWLTSDNLPTDDFICRVLRIPNDLYTIANVNGAVLSLCEPFNWQKFGTVTVEQTVAAMTEMYDNYAAGSVCLIGSIILYATATAPDNTLLCDGSSHLRVDYPQLYSVLASRYIVDADHFVTPAPPSLVGLNYFIVAR